MRRNSNTFLASAGLAGMLVLAACGAGGGGDDDRELTLQGQQLLPICTMGGDHTASTCGCATRRMEDRLSSSEMTDFIQLMIVGPDMNASEARRRDQDRYEALWSRAIRACD